MNVISLLKLHEGFVSHAYQDSEGYWTIGVGRLIDKRLNGGISETEADFLLTHDVQRCEGELDDYFPWWRSLSPTRRMALTDMCFNLGIHRLSGFKNMLASLKDGRYSEAAQHAKDSRWAAQVKSRADHIAHMFECDELPKELK